MARLPAVLAEASEGQAAPIIMAMVAAVMLDHTRVAAGPRPGSLATLIGPVHKRARDMSAVTTSICLYKGNCVRMWVCVQ